MGIFGSIDCALWFFFYTWKRSEKMQSSMDRLLLKLPFFDKVIPKATIARFSRTFSSMFVAGVPLVEALDSVTGPSGNRVYYDATKKIQS